MANSVSSVASISPSRCRSESAGDSTRPQIIQSTPFEPRLFPCRSAEAAEKHVNNCGGTLAVYDPYMAVQQRQQPFYNYPYPMQFQKSAPDILLPPVNMMSTFWNQPTALSSAIPAYQFSPVPLPLFTTQRQTNFSPFPMPIPLKKVKKNEPKQPSACSYVFCGGIAQLLWIIVGIVVTGMTAALILALMVV